jgi:5-methylcytosine-specific restriction endonuclease McrA
MGLIPISIEKHINMAKTFNQVAAIRGALRRVFSRSPIVRQVMSKVRREVPKLNKDGSRAKKDAVQYQCSACREWIKSTAISVDHVVPVIGVDEGFVNWDEFVARLFCGEDNLQVVCDTCHRAKTNSERNARLGKRYNAQLDVIEAEALLNPKDAIKALSKFTKKNTPGLESIGLRARILQARLKGAPLKSD